MNKMQNLKEKWNEKTEKLRPGLDKAGSAGAKIGYVLRLIGTWIYRFRALILAAPVVVEAIRLAQLNSQRLPEMVGIDLQTNGEYAYLVTRALAVNAPLAITALCILLMFLSRKVVYPWVISVFSLVLPLVIYYTNVFPA